MGLSAELVNSQPYLRGGTYSVSQGQIKQQPANWQNVAVPLASLPTAAVAGAAARAFQSDSAIAASGSFGAAATSGGTYGVPLFSDGMTWRVG